MAEVNASRVRLDPHSRGASEGEADDCGVPTPVTVRRDRREQAPVAGEGMASVSDTQVEKKRSRHSSGPRPELVERADLRTHHWTRPVGFELTRFGQRTPRERKGADKPVETINGNVILRSSPG
jgi:hypothetical protein